MIPCNLCNAMLGRAGHTPPHRRLVKCPAEDTQPPQGKGFHYMCQDCGYAIALVSDDDGSDTWVSTERPS